MLTFEFSLQDEIVGVLDLVEAVLTKFGFNKYDVMLSTRPEKSVGTDDIWEAATNALVGTYTNLPYHSYLLSTCVSRVVTHRWSFELIVTGALNRKGWKYGVDDGGGAFYGPKIDIKIQDAIGKSSRRVTVEKRIPVADRYIPMIGGNFPGRTWQCSTVQCDFNLPERFDLEYASEDNTRKRPIMVHRAIFGSIERFFGVLLESTAGDFPLWLSPTQVRLLPVTDNVSTIVRGPLCKI